MEFDLNANNFRTDIEGFKFIQLGFRIEDSVPKVIITCSDPYAVYRVTISNDAIDINFTHKTWNVDAVVNTIRSQDKDEEGCEIDCITVYEVVQKQQ